jgi:hypothetical protein
MQHESQLMIIDLKDMLAIEDVMISRNDFRALKPIINIFKDKPFEHIIVNGLGNELMAYLSKHRRHFV